MHQKKKIVLHLRSPTILRKIGQMYCMKGDLAWKAEDCFFESFFLTLDPKCCLISRLHLHSPLIL